jgi:rsbT co-antagonist protein RsbR
LEQRQFAAITMLDVSKIIDLLIDKISRIYGEVYEEHNNKLMRVAYTALEELTVPVVPIVEGIAIIPIIGDIDTHRARLIMDISLNEGERLKLFLQSIFYMFIELNAFLNAIALSPRVRNPKLINK